MNILIAIIISYLIGSVPTAYIFGRLYKQIDIREYGSGNVGATNVFRVLGKTPGIIVLVIDIIKGIIPITLIGDLFNCETLISRILLGLAVVSGHNWTVFLKFKGGKGIATSLGVLIGLSIKFIALRIVLVSCVLIWIMCFLATGYVSLSSIFAAIFMPIIMVITRQSLEMVVMGIIFCIFVVLRHRPNIKRLLDGTESKASFPFRRKK